MQAELVRSPVFTPAMPQKFAALSARLAEVSAARDADEELWLALELKREDTGRRLIIVEMRGTAPP